MARPILPWSIRAYPVARSPITMARPGHMVTAARVGCLHGHRPYKLLPRRGGIIKIDFSPCLIVTVFESVNLFHNPYYALGARSHLFSAFHRHI